MIYSKCWKYLKESRKFILAAIILFVVASLVGFFFPVFFVDSINNLIKQLAGNIKGMNFLQLFLYIFQNNIMTAFFAIALGIFLGIPAIIMGIVNGYVLGFVAGKTVGVSGYAVLLRLLPHGIFELPALFISLGLGMKLSSFLFVKKKKKQLLYDLENALYVFVYVILPLLLIAAAIESGLIILFG